MTFVLKRTLADGSAFFVASDTSIGSSAINAKQFPTEKEAAAFMSEFAPFFSGLYKATPLPEPETTP